MPYCSILECKNDSRRRNLSNGGVSYHRFPKDSEFKEKWIDATGRVNWMPTKISTICSEHFLEEDFLISNKGYRYTKPTAVPTLKIIQILSQQQISNNTTASPSGTKELKKKASENIDSESDSNYSTPRERKLKSQLRFCKSKIKNQGLKIKRLQSKNRNLKDKIKNMDEILTTLQNMIMKIGPAALEL